jgi:hypothetical protein
VNRNYNQVIKWILIAMLVLVIGVPFLSFMLTIFFNIYGGFIVIGLVIAVMLLIAKDL